MIRFLRIARREYLAYVRTWGFWLNLLLLPVGLSTIVLAPLVMNHSIPPPNVAVADFTGHGLEKVAAAALAAPGPAGKPLGRLVSAPGAPYRDAADAAARLRPYLQGRSMLPGGTTLDYAAIVRPAGGSVALDFWSRNVADSALENTLSDKVTQALRRERLRALGLSEASLAAVDATGINVADYSPKAAAGKVAFKDRLPAVAGLGMGFLLWMVVMTGAGMLLNSVIEEKSSRILEVMLSSASVPEIMLGKIFGVAAVTGTILLFWMSIGALVLSLRSGAMAADVAQVFLAHGLWAYFAVYLLGGYLMFAALYVTVGAFCETSREAQTLLGPMMILMTIPMLFMTQAIGHPDAPLLRVLMWVPIFTPFMMAARAAADPPLWEILATGALVFAVTALELWLAIPAFKSGALATGRFNLRHFIASLARRGAF
jgi:ABC-2 type transport system permease protein